MAALSYLGTPPPLGEAQPLTAGVHWVRLPVPGALKHINVWLLEDGAGFTLVDTGMDVPAARAAWQGALADYLGGRPLTRILCTHHHPDHAGLAAWLAERWGVPVLMSEPEFRLLRRFEDIAADPSAGAWRVEGFARDGLVATEATRAALSGALYRTVVSGLPAEVQTVVDGEVLIIGERRWRALILAGHTDAQIVLHEAASGLLIAGDQVLPRITSNVGIYPERADPDPVTSFLASFGRLEALSPEPLVLPSHGEVFRGLGARLAELRAHHAATLERVRGLVAGPTTARELAEQLFRSPLEGLNLTLAVGEALAHLEHLARQGALECIEPPGGPRRYRPAGGTASPGHG
jgi:glyoxylase-like metal-dependent hydrolase (beta-lactamase superfamily II)